MSTSTLLFNLLAGALGAVAVWLLVRALCARFAAGRARPGCGPNPSTAQANLNGQPGGQKDEAEDGRMESTPEAVAAVYRRALLRRLGGLLLCLAAFGAWLSGTHWLVGLFLAGVGCLLQYLAYRLRTCYALSIARQKQAETARAIGNVSAGDDEREKILSGHENARLSDKGSPELLHIMGKGL